MNDVKERAQLVDVVEFSGQSAAQVEPETVDVHLQHPVPEAVHDELQNTRTQHVERVPAAGEVGVVPVRLVLNSVVRLVVDSTQRNGRPQMVAFTGVVVDHVQDNFEPRLMQSANHPFELAHCFVRSLRRRIPRFRREEGHRVVAPVIGEVLLHQMAVVDVVMDRHEFHGRHAQFQQVPNRCLRCQPQIGSS